LTSYQTSESESVTEMASKMSRYDTIRYDTMVTENIVICV